MNRRNSVQVAIWIFLLCAGPLVHGAISFTTLLSFDGTNGALPEASLIQAKDGFLYGTTLYGGTNFAQQPGGFGTVFRISTNAQFTSLLSFPTQANPQSGLLEAVDGSFYGVADMAGNGNGSFYRLTPAGEYSQLYAFDYQVATYPHGITEGPDGAFYGTGYWGGDDPKSLGTVFKVTTNGFAAVLASFHGTNGSNPQAKLLLASDGLFYGTTTAGGAFDLGTVFRITPAGLLSTVVSFNGTNGAMPFCALMQARDGLIYGTTYGGGIGFSGPSYSGNGTLFSIDTNGVFTPRYQFRGYPDDATRPSFAALIQDANGSFYGTSEAGGSGGSGSIFRMSPDGAVDLLYSFSTPDYNTGTNLDGAEPSAGLVQANDTDFYGVTMSGGAHGRGVVFRLSVVPEPLTLRAAPTADGSALVLTWNALIGATYEVQSTTELAPPFWQPLLRVVAADQNPKVSDIIKPNDHRFYRVLKSP